MTHPFIPEGATNVIERPCGCISWFEPFYDEVHARPCSNEHRSLA